MNKQPALLILLSRQHDFIGRLIKFQTRGPFTHAALVKDHHFIIEANQGEGVVRNSIAAYPTLEYDLFEITRPPLRVLRREGNGRYTAQASDTTTAADDKDFFNPDRAWEFAERQLAKGYDYTMVIRFVTRRQETRETCGKWFCSELVYAAIRAGGLDLLANTQPWEVSPNLLAKSPFLRKVS